MEKVNTKIQSIKKRINTEKIILIVLSVLFSLYAITLFFPMLWIFYNSVRHGSDFVFRQWQVTPLTIINYVNLFKETPMLTMVLNSLVLAIVTSTFQIFATASMAHATASFRWRGSSVFYFIAISVMFIPTSGTLGIVYRLMSDLNLLDLHIGVVILASNGMGFSFLMLYSVYKNISPTYAEAAEIDGAGYWRRFLTIITPQASATLIAMWILGFIGCWNDYAFPKIFLPSHKTLAVGVYEFSTKASQTGGTGYPQLFAAISISIIPILILFLAFQKQIMTISVGGGIKE